ncbi:hypothetical protein GQX74_006435, partial [Glossina fuscipes]
MQKFFKLIKCEIREKSGHQNIGLRADLSVVLSTFISDSLYSMDKCLRRQHLIIRVKSSQVKSNQIVVNGAIHSQYNSVGFNAMNHWTHHNIINIITITMLGCQLHKQKSIH